MFEGLVDFFYNEAYVDDIDKHNDDDVDSEVDECWCFKKVRSLFRGSQPGSQVTALDTPG